MQRCEQSHRHVRAELRGIMLADSIAPMLVWLNPYPTTYAFPREDVRMDLLRESAHEDDRVWFDAELDGAVVERVAWAPRRMPELGDRIVIEWAAMDRWLEEDEEIHGHPRDPHVRCDAIRSSRHVRIRIHGELVADSTRPTLLFETDKPTRYYLPLEDVRGELLEASERTSYCPYKGRAAYHSVRIGDRLHEDIVWHYAEPFDEVGGIRGLLAFFDEKVEVEVDGVVQPTPVTAWS